jgi:beta-lactamase regulating signal transducer with metallopeptidase domain
MLPVSATLVAFLLNAGVQITIVGIASAIALRVAGSAPARVKHHIAVTALVLGALVPIVSSWMARNDTATATFVPASIDARAVAADRVVMALVYGYGILLAWKLWLLMRAVLSAIALRRTCTPIVDGPVVASFHRCATDGRIEVCRSPHIATPLTLGFVNPMIIVPDALASDDPAVIDAVMAHECAHVARHDVAVGTVIEILTAPFAFHPVVAALKRAAAKYRELACDEQAIERLGIAPRAYAAALLRVAEFAAAPAAVGAGIASHLETRIRELLKKDGESRGTVITRALAYSCVIASLVIAPLFAIAVDNGWRDISGTWTLDIADSEPRGRVPFQSARMQIETNGNHLVIAQQRTRSNGRFETFEIRGTADDVPFKVYLPGSAALQTRARWEGNRLITDAFGPGRRYREHGEAVAEGDRLVIRADNAYDGARTTYQLVFRRE